MATLLMVLKREWFDKIASGEKTQEFREYKKYWCDKLLGRQYDEILFTMGYHTDGPKMRVEFKGFTVENQIYPLTGEVQKLFVIDLGRVLELKNYDGKKRQTTKKSRESDKIRS